MYQEILLIARTAKPYYTISSSLDLLVTVTVHCLDSQGTRHTSCLANMNISDSVTRDNIHKFPTVIMAFSYKLSTEVLPVTKHT